MGENKKTKIYRMRRGWGWDEILEGVFFTPVISMIRSSDPFIFTSSELLIIEIPGVKNTPSKISTHPHPRLRLYFFVFFFSHISRSALIFLVDLKAIFRQ